MARFTEALESFTPTQEYTPAFDQPLPELLELTSLIPRGEPETFGATPLDKLSTIKQQNDLLTLLLHQTYRIPDGVSLEIADYVHDTFRDRFYSRLNANDENYTTSLLEKSHYADNPEIIELIQRGETGHASPFELLITQKLLGVRSVELACLTHPYGERIEMLGEMRRVVDESVYLMGGETLSDELPWYRIKDVILNSVPREEWASVFSLSNRERLEIADEYGGVAGLLVTRKRDLGRMPDGTLIRERSSFVLRADAVITRSDFEALLDVDADIWDDTALEASRLDERIAELMAQDQHNVAIPIASTIYAFNKDIAKLVYRQRSLRPSRENHINIEQAEQELENLRQAHHVEDFDGMLYIGPKLNLKD